MALTIQEGQPRKSSHPRLGDKIRRLQDRYGWAFRAAKLAAGSAIGFLDTEIILTLGTYLLYGKLSAPVYAFSSLNFLFLNVAAFVIGVSVAFFVSDSLIERGQVRCPTGISQVLEKLGKFQLIFLAGNLVMIGIEMLLLKELAFPPSLGIVVGSIVAFPISYYFSMHFVWQSRDYGSRTFEEFTVQRKMPQFFLHDVGTKLPRHIETPYGNYNLDVHEYRLDIYPRRDGGGRVEFALKVDLAPEE